MVSSKGEPDNPELREKVKEEVKAMSKGGGPGSWSAWKAGELARRYEAKGGGYKDKGDHKNKSQKGPPEPKKEDKKSSEKETKKEEKKEEDKKEDKKESEDKSGEKQADDKKDDGKTQKGGKAKAGGKKK